LSLRDGMSLEQALRSRAGWHSVWNYRREYNI
jgi:hypothetical protein